MQASDGMRFVMETPELHASRAAQAFMQQEIERPSKQWIQEVIKSDRESECVKLRTCDFVLLPDINGHRRQVRAYRARTAIQPAHWMSQQSAWRYPPSDTGGWRDPTPQRWSPVHHGQSKHTRAQSWPQEIDDKKLGFRPSALKRFSWLSIVADPELRSIRDLRGEHIGMLEVLYAQCVESIQKEYKVSAEDIMVFANYPPSVYKLHFHFCAPFFQPTAYDAFRMHSLSSIINNLKLHPMYYSMSTFQIAVHSGSDLYRAIAQPLNEGDAEEFNE